MNLRILALLFVAVLVASAFPVVAAAAKDPAKVTGFDEYGYNYQARIFNGKADGVDHMLDGMVWGDPTYANDQVVMKWTKEWDRGNAENWANGPYTGAWEDNEWNGLVPGGSGEIWHYKIVWVGSKLESSPYWHDGGYPIWGQFEVIMSHGTVDSVHIWDVRATPAGYGA